MPSCSWRPRRSEVVTLDVGDIVPTAGGLRVVIKRRKGDQEGAGDLRRIGATGTATCPVAAYATWIARARITTGPAFRSVARHNQIGPAVTACRRMAGRSAAAYSSSDRVALIV